jgi:Zn-dependent M16 (insulinase) family peptidase
MRAAQLIEAYSRSKQIIDDFVQGKRAFQRNVLENARSSCIYDQISRLGTARAAAKHGMYDFLKRVAVGRTERVLRSIQAVEVDDLKRVCAHLAQLFNPNTTLVATVGPKKVSDVATFFAENSRQSISTYASIDELSKK